MKKPMSVSYKADVGGRYVTFFFDGPEAQYIIDEACAMATRIERQRITALLVGELVRVSKPMLVDREYIDGIEEAIRLVEWVGK